MFEEIDRIASQLAKMEEVRSELAKRMRFNSGKIDFGAAFEKELIRKVEKIQVNCKVAAVDGGITAQEFHAFDLLLGRAVAVMFEYENTKIKSHAYFPRAIPDTKADLKGGLDNHDIQYHRSLFRLEQELSVAKGAIEKFKPDYLFLDGSIAPLIADKPADDSPVRSQYMSVVERYKELYAACAKHECCLVGVIKDSRGRRFIEIIEKHTGNEDGFRNSSDTNFLYYMLEEGERTFTFRYSSDPAKHQVLKDLGEWSDKILTFYLKPMSDDRPLRVEFLSGKRSFDEIASLIYSLSRINKSYAYPAILIEADLRAAMDRTEIESVYSRLLGKLGKGRMMKLRRDTRPFR
jgi:hypothetical protein